MRKWTVYARSRTNSFKTAAHMRIIFLTGLICLQLLYPSAGIARGDRIDRMIIKYKDTTDGNHQVSQKRATLQRGATRLSRSKLRSGNNAELYNLERARTVAEAEQLARELMQDPEIEYAEPDYRRYPAMVPNDPGYLPSQWYLKQASIAEPGAINAELAWDVTTGNASIVIAVIDTGILPHEDINNGRVLPGRDFISDIDTANDGNGRDSNPTDAGDAVEADECGTDDPEENRPSSWHGTKVSGVIIADTNNSRGIAGVDHQAFLLPLRALGKCGGSSFDIADAIRWAAGLPVANPVTLNPNPADVINLSLGSRGPCTATEQAAITAAVEAGVVVVAAAGNEGFEGISSPANCENVIAVAATSRDGAETCYTNVGTDVDLSAPGGNDSAGVCDGNDFISSTSNSGNNGASSGDDFYDIGLMGTSFSTPLVAGAAALMKAINPDLTPTSIEAILKSSARIFPEGTDDGFGDCNTDRCGDGILDVFGAVTAAANGGLDSVPNPFTFNDRGNVALNTSYTSNRITITGIDSPAAISISGDGEYSINNGDFTDAPGTINAGQNVRLRLQSPAQAGRTASARLTIGGITDTFSLSAPAFGSSGDGGGGGGEAVWLLPLCALVLQRRRRKLITERTEK
jgi:serine protease